MPSTPDLKPNVLAPTEHSGGALRMPEYAMFAWGVYVEIPHPDNAPPQMRPMLAMMAAHDAHARRIEELTLLVEMLIDLGGPELLAKMTASYMSVGHVKSGLQLDALTKLREISIKLVEHETKQQTMPEKQD